MLNVTVTRGLSVPAPRTPTWGYTRLRDALKHLGHEICRNTVKRILQEHGITPAPERGTRTPWKTFLASHWEGLAAADFFTVEVLTPFGLARYWVFFVIELKTRRVEIAGITSQPCGAWMQRIGRHLTGWDGFLEEKTHLILDRDPLYTGAFAQPEESPSGRQFAPLAYDSLRGQVVLFGGQGGWPFPESPVDTWGF